jgi:hypothetical protein
MHADISGCKMTSISQRYEDWIFFVDTKLERFGEDCVCATNEEQELQDKLNEKSNVCLWRPPVCHKHAIYL